MQYSSSQGFNEYGTNNLSRVQNELNQILKKSCIKREIISKVHNSPVDYTMSFIYYDRHNIILIFRT